ncbi:unnamed protein product [Lactuca saligna]|uniref:Uncharacterized protein n=1 Tax=Lactuca saligna TaxID=75948 RepID=A0AA35Z1E0_LACSI|nr:unnamed protein product [Lactuca saligna]
MTSSSVRWLKTETNLLNTEEHHFKTNLRRAKNNQKHDLSACPRHYSIIQHEWIGILKAYRIEIQISSQVPCRLTANVKNQDKKCPLNLKEAIWSLCFFAPRCADFIELVRL